VHGVLASGSTLAALAQRAVKGLTMEALYLWGIAFAFAAAGKHQPAAILSGIPWWHRLLGIVIATAIFGGHLWPVIHGLMSR
jgi:hypothetical protein